MNERTLCTIMKNAGYIIIDAWTDDNAKYIEFALTCAGSVIRTKLFESKINKNKFEEVK